MNPTLQRWQRTEALYHAARARPPAERAAFLAESCGDDEALRREVESLLNEPVSESGFAEGPALSMRAQGVVDGLPDAPVTMTGRTLGDYRLQTLLGAGGMGEVYRARDGTLGRDVAIKILPPTVTRDPDRLARFEREARSLAALNHPNICAIYGLETADGIRFLILELVDGQTLADLIGRNSGPLTPDATLPIARQIAEALEAAHERGIVHRDLKPANIKITPEGVVKLLDFGLAKSAGGDGSSPDITQALTWGGTHQGVVMGTAAYMSPEQACGKPVDRRTDIWAFGCVLFEMVTGRRPFSGDTLSDTLAAVLKTDPDWSVVPATVSPDLRRLLRRCLEKDPKRRLQAIGDARIQIEELESGAGEEPIPGAREAPMRPGFRFLPWVVAGALAIGLAAMVAWNLRAAPQPSITRFLVPVPSNQLLDGSGGAHLVALSPDGAQIAYVTSPGRLHLRRMSQLNATVIPGTEAFDGVREPAFSPDGGSIAFFAVGDQTIKKIAVTGGAAATLCPADSPTGISWGPDGILFGQGSKGILRVSPDGGPAQQIVSLKDGETAQSPQMLPDGQHLLFTLATGAAPDRWDRARIVVQSVASQERTPLDVVGTDARYVPTGHLVYALGGRMFAIAFDVRRLAVKGGPVPIIEGVSRAAGTSSETAPTGGANFSFARTGSLAYVPGPVSLSPVLRDIAVQDRNGRSTPLSLQPGPYAVPRVAPDGKRIAFGNDDGKQAIVWIYDLSGTSAVQQFTFAGNSRYPVWTSDSRRVAFQSDREGDLAVFWQPVEGGLAERLTKPDPGTSHEPESWSPDGDTLLVSLSDASGVSLASLSIRDKRLTPFKGVRSSTPLGAVFSPDGKWVAYASTVRSVTTLHVQPFPPTGADYQLPSKLIDTPKHPRWSPDGKELFYNPRPRGFEVVRITTHPTFTFGNAVSVPKVFQGGPPNSRTSYDITPQGRFVGLISAGQTEHVLGSLDQIQVILNWFEDLKARVPATR